VLTSLWVKGRKKRRREGEKKRRREEEKERRGEYPNQ
jgi:hypothetical protein